MAPLPVNGSGNHTAFSQAVHAQPDAFGSLQDGGLKWSRRQANRQVKQLIFDFVRRDGFSFNCKLSHHSPWFFFLLFRAAAVSSANDKENKDVSESDTARSRRQAKG
jgi:hypothetical protein